MKKTKKQFNNSKSPVWKVETEWLIGRRIVWDGGGGMRKNLFINVVYRRHKMMKRLFCDVKFCHLETFLLMMLLLSWKFQDDSKLMYGKTFEDVRVMHFRCWLISSVIMYYGDLSIGLLCFAVVSHLQDRQIYKRHTVLPRKIIRE